MDNRQNELQILDQKLIEIDSTPDLSKHKTVVILKQEEFVKLLTQLEAMKEPWIAMKFNDTIFVVWNELIFLHVTYNGEEENLQKNK